MQNMLVARGPWRRSGVVGDSGRMVNLPSKSRAGRGGCECWPFHGIMPDRVGGAPRGKTEVRGAGAFVASARSCVVDSDQVYPREWALVTPKTKNTAAQRPCSWRQRVRWRQRDLRGLANIAPEPPRWTVARRLRPSLLEWVPHVRHPPVFDRDRCRNSLGDSGPGPAGARWSHASSSHAAVARRRRSPTRRSCQG